MSINTPHNPIPADLQMSRPQVPPDAESVRVLEECKDLQRRKSQDYQNPSSSVKQAHHYRRGVATIFDMMDQKMRRAQSIIETMEANPNGVAPNFESLEDTFKDIINYSSFAVSYLRGKMAGQLPARDALNRQKPLLQQQQVVIGGGAAERCEPALMSQFLTEGKGAAVDYSKPIEPKYEKRPVYSQTGQVKGYVEIHDREAGDHGC